MKSKSFKSKVLYLFTRNSDLSKLNPFLNIFKLILGRIKSYFAVKTHSLEILKSHNLKKNLQSWTILHYQRISDFEMTPVNIGRFSFVKPNTFAMHCEILSKNTNVISLDRLCNILLNGSLPEPGTIVITVDGGFNDFFLNGSKSILAHSLPATLCVPTALIGSKAFLFDDQIATSLSIFHSSKTTLEPFTSLDPKLQNSLNETLLEGVPTNKSVSALITILFSLDQNVRSKILKELGEQLIKIELDIPPWQDFMSWDDLRHLASLGFDIISKFHTHPFPLDLSEAQVVAELAEVKRSFLTNGINQLPIISLPYGIYSLPVLEDLMKNNYSFALSSDIPPPLIYQEEFPIKVLKRTTMIEGNTFTKDLFLKQIFNLD